MDKIQRYKVAHYSYYLLRSDEGEWVFQGDVAALEAENKAMREWMEAYTSSVIGDEYLKNRGWELNGYYWSHKNEQGIYAQENALFFEAKRILGGE